MTTAGSHKVIRLREWGRVASIALEPHEIRTINESKGGVRIAATAIPGHYDLEAAQFVGTIAGPGLRLYIEPKVPIARVLYLLGYLSTGPELGPRTRLHQDEQLLNAMQRLYADALDRALRRGLLHAYRVRGEALAAPRGRIDAMALVTRRFGAFPPIDCTFDDFTADTEINRRLLAAAVMLSRVRSEDVTDAVRLRRLADRFEGVSLGHYDPRRVDPLVLDRRSLAFAEAVRLAEIVLRNTSLELRDGHTDSAGFVVDMNAVFEQFVVRALQRAIGKGWHEWRYHPPGMTIDVGGRFRMTPDVLLEDRGSPQLVIDVKYKSRGSGDAGDVQQMIAYCTALGIRRAAVIYADVTEERHRIRKSDIEIAMFGLDLDGPPNVLEERVRALAEKIRALVAS
jgi:5-methylcytosine-specific restriction enzyme subunit McrC